MVRRRQLMMAQAIDELRYEPGLYGNNGHSGRCQRLRLAPGTLTSARSDLRVAEPERQAAEEECSGGPGGEHAEALPGGERQGADIGRGLDFQTRGHRGDLFQVPPPGPGADRGGEER